MAAVKARLTSTSTSGIRATMSRSSARKSSQGTARRARTGSTKHAENPPRKATRSGPDLPVT
jgi:hypothetical protein